MIEQLNVPSEKILVLVLNKSHLLEWKEKVNPKSSGKLSIMSYYSFIQDEIKTFYPIIVKSCEDIVKKRISPLFLTFEPAQFLLSKVIEARRTKKGIFSGVASYSDRIAADLATNLVRAAISDISTDEIGDRLYNALEIKDDEKKQIFSEADDILKDYRKKCTELGVYDFGMAVDLYNSCLLKNDNYKMNLFKRIHHLIVDNIEECVPAEVDFIELLLPELKTSLLGYNHEGGYGKCMGGNHDYVKQKLTGKLDAVNLNGSFTCSSYMYEFSDMFFENIEDCRKSGIKPDVIVERQLPVELRSEMMEKVGGRVCQLISDEGYRPSDIVILSTHADPVTEYVIAGILEKKGFILKNIGRKSRATDNCLVRSMITIAQICHHQYGILPGRDELRVLISELFDVDPVRCSKLAGIILAQSPFADFPDMDAASLVEFVGHNNASKYTYLNQWIKDYRRRETPLKLDEFLQKVFIEIFLTNQIRSDDITRVNHFISSCHNFIEVVARFNRNANKDFLEMSIYGIKAADDFMELERSINSDFVILATPLSYLASTLKCKVLILTSLSSKNWVQRSMKELTNYHVLTKTWDVNNIYTEQMEEINQKHYLAVMMRAILKRCCDRVITFESNISANGYENEGILAEFFNELLEHK